MATAEGAFVAGGAPLEPKRWSTTQLCKWSVDVLKWRMVIVWDMNLVSRSQARCHDAQVHRHTIYSGARCFTWTLLPPNVAEIPRRAAAYGRTSNAGRIALKDELMPELLAVHNKLALRSSARCHEWWRARARMTTLSLRNVAHRRSCALWLWLRWRVLGAGAKVQGRP
jgi:hypothetical protein